VESVASQAATAALQFAELAGKNRKERKRNALLGHAAVTRAQAHMLRDLFGNPFRAAPTLEPSLLHWNGGPVVRLAGAASDQRMMPEGQLDPARLAVLADALEEAGAPEQVLAHLRARGPHVRGCWCLDLLLDRS